jgi:hypothetical protein
MLIYLKNSKISKNGLSIYLNCGFNLHPGWPRFKRNGFGKVICLEQAKSDKQFKCAEKKSLNFIVIPAVRIHFPIVPATGKKLFHTPAISTL